ncbi:MAG: hypothetical protein RL264_2553 [Bacteroidota bacterium]|jgi:two-component system LytT family response regulator
MNENLFDVLIVDDLKIHRDNLLDILKKEFDCFRSIYFADSVDDALAIIENHKIDLLFLDVEMPGKNGFELVKSLEHDVINFEIIFVTAYDRYAINAIRSSALDFILKPIDRKELKEAVDRFLNKATNKTKVTSTNIQQFTQFLMKRVESKIALPSLHGFVFVNENEIIQCEADNTYTTFHLISNKRIIISKTLKECEEILNSHLFFRLHNSHIVNLDFIKEYVRGEGGHVVLINDQIVPVSRSKKQTFLSMIKRI